MDRFQVDGDGDLPMADATPPRRIAQPRRRLGHVVTNLSIAYQNVRPIVDPALRVITGGVQRGVKRGADSFLEARDRFFTAWVETRQSRDDGLIIKRFKRLPIDPKKVSNPHAQLPNQLPVDYLKSLPNDQFRWTDDAFVHLGKENHELVKRFFGDFKTGMQAYNFVKFDGIEHAIDPREVPDEISAEIRALSKNEPLSVVLHNHMIKESLADDGAVSHNDTSQKLWQDLHLFDSVYQDVYEKDGRLAIHKNYSLKPYGPLKYPYDTLGRCPLVGRSQLLDCINMLRFFLSQRDAFNLMFPVETVGGIIADFDAIHKDEPAPSHVDWPGKEYQRCPGLFPEDATYKILFETVPAGTFEPLRRWDHQHPSPSRHLTAADYDTPHRTAMKKNQIFFDDKGQAQAKKTHLKKEHTGPIQKKQARFMSSPVAWYATSNNVPVPNRETSSPSPSPESTTPVTPTKQIGAIRFNTPLTWTMQKVNEEAQQQGESPVYGGSRTGLAAKQPPKYKNIDDFFANDDKGPFGKGLPLRISTEKAADLEVRQQLEQDGCLRAQREIERLAEEKRRLAEEERLKAEREHLRVQEELRLAEQRRQQEEDRKLAENGELRAPHRTILPSMSKDWTDKVTHTLHARSNVELAKSPDGTVLQRKDFETVVPQNQWLNDEIVNATLLHLGNYVNQKAGIKNTRVRTPKIQIFNSFVGKNLDEGRPPTERMLRRAGIRKDNFLDIETILIPLCRGKHWTVVAIRPKHRQIYHLDSLSNSADRALVAKVVDWIQGVLGDDYIEDEWKAETLTSPRQSNFDDCGVHTITNGICLGLGITPSSYSATMMPRQRLHLAAVLLNGGFDQEFTLDGI